MHRGCFVWTPTPPLAGRRTPRPGPVRVCVCLLFLAGSGGPASRARSGAPHLFLLPLCLSPLLGPLRAGVAPLFFAAVAFPRWLFFSASRCLARASFVSSAWPLAALWWLLPCPAPLCVSGFRRSCLWPWCFFFFFFFLLLSPCAPVVSNKGNTKVKVDEEEALTASQTRTTRTRTRTEATPTLIQGGTASPLEGSLVLPHAHRRRPSENKGPSGSTKVVMTATVKKTSRFMSMARKLRNKGFEVTCLAAF